MKPLTTHQRNVLVRRIERELVWTEAQQHLRDRAHYQAGKIVDALEWTGVHGASEKRAVELVVANAEEVA